MFELPRVVIKSDRLMIDALIGKTLHVAPEYDHDFENNIRQWFEICYSVCLHNYPVDDSYLHQANWWQHSTSRQLRPFLSHSKWYKIVHPKASFWDSCPTNDYTFLGGRSPSHCELLGNKGQQMVVSNAARAMRQGF
jgi:hypothetical protein